MIFNATVNLPTPEILCRVFLGTGWISVVGGRSSDGQLWGDGPGSDRPPTTDPQPVWKSGRGAVCGWFEVGLAI